MKESQKIGFFSITIIVVSLMVGMGIFKTPATIAAKSGSEFIFFAAWIVGGIISLFGALVYGEIGQRLPVMGGYYKIFSHCYHPAIGFTVNILMLVSNAASLAVIALIGSDYVSDLLFSAPSDDFFNVIIAATSVTLFYLLNLLGLRSTSFAQNILTIIKTALIILLIAAIFKDVTIVPHGYNEGEIYSYDTHHPAILFIIALVSVSFTYQGYQQAINFGSEVSPKALYRGIIVGVVIATTLYLAINYAYIKVIGFEEIKNANAIGALLTEVWFGRFGAKIFDFFMVLSVLAYVNVSLLSNPRVMFSMSEDKVLPKIFQHKHHKTEALKYALGAFALVTVVVALFGKKVDDILSFVIFLDCIGMTSSVATLFILRRKKQGDDVVNKKFAKITPILCVIYIISYLAISVAVVIDKPFSALSAVVLLFLVLLLYKPISRKLRH